MATPHNTRESETESYNGVKWHWDCGGGGGSFAG